MTSFKQERAAGRILEILSELLLREVADPRLQLITITEVKLDPELAYARIYINAMGNEGRKDEVMGALKKAKGFLRREVAQRIDLRSAPDLVFIWDETLERSERINRLLESLDIPKTDTPKAGTDDC
jgi:ribosome-binding factor A